LYVCDNANDRIRKIDGQTGIITTVLGRAVIEFSGLVTAPFAPKAIASGGGRLCLLDC
jgi:hypothetical protein